jgi:hypothetical protein
LIFVGGEIFLKGTYVEVGIHSVGSYGTSQGAPSGFVYQGQQLGFIADFDKNGWYSSAPGYAGDFFVPGAPVEGLSSCYFVKHDTHPLSRLDSRIPELSRCR